MEGNNCLWRFKTSYIISNEKFMFNCETSSLYRFNRNRKL